MSDEKTTNTDEILLLILKELKSQSNLIHNLNTEIDQLKQILLLSRNNIQDVSTSIPHLGFGSSNPLMSLERPIQKNQKTFDDSSLVHDEANTTLNLEEILGNLNEETLKILLNIWNSSKNIFNGITEALKDKNFENFVIDCYKLLISILEVMNTFLNTKDPMIFSQDQSLLDIAEKLGPLPIILDYDLLDFINMKNKDQDYSIGEKTAIKLFEKIEKTVNSLNDLLSIIIQK